MNAFVEYVNGGYNFTDFLAAIVLLAAITLSAEKLFQWIYKYFMKLYRAKKGQEDELSSIEKNTNEIKKLSENVDNLASLLNRQYAHLDKKIDEQKEHLISIDTEGQKRDRAILRDRILGGMRYFGRQKENGAIHISVSDHENMEHLFKAYFSCKGNGTIKSLYENEFRNWIIDK